MGHINFENIVKIKNWWVVWDIPRIINPLHLVYKHYEYGKQTRVSFNSK